MPNDELSRAVVVYVWGDRSEPWPSERVEALVAQFGDRGLDLIPQVRRIAELLDAAPEEHESLAEATARVERSVRDRITQT